ncbi:MAG: 4a-hydroxytetrahydrobiopterin dehydratase [Phycisphaerales bacterium]|jgi:4a-hydroxytetrahydrobiopterin dehydratase
MTQLAEKQCVPCRGGVEPLKGEAVRQLEKELEPGWRVVDEHHLEREFKFKDFREALEFVNEVGELAESENHHPDIQLSYGKVVIQLWTHKIDGLHENDFILAAKIDALTAVSVKEP